MSQEELPVGIVVGMQVGTGGGDHGVGVGVGPQEIMGMLIADSGFGQSNETGVAASFLIFHWNGLAPTVDGAVIARENVFSVPGA